MPPISSSQVTEAIIRRRTNLRIDTNREVDPEILAELCEMACWAPNHKRTEPWRFAIFLGDGRKRLGDTIAASMEAHDFPVEKIEKTRTKYLRAPSVVVVASITNEHPKIEAENRDAVSAAVQNMLLSATDKGLASFWSSLALPSDPGLLDLCNFEPGSVAVAAVYFGHPLADLIAPERTPPVIEWITD